MVLVGASCTPLAGACLQAIQQAACRIWADRLQAGSYRIAPIAPIAPIVPIVRIAQESAASYLLAGGVGGWRGEAGFVGQVGGVGRDVVEQGGGSGAAGAQDRQVAVVFRPGARATFQATS